MHKNTIQTIISVIDEQRSTGPSQKLTKKFIEENIFVDDVQQSKDGSFILRQGYFYTSGKTEIDFSKSIVNQFDKTPFKIVVLDRGTVSKPFKGGASIRSQSHWWVKIKLVDEPV
jgi:hypothetical protein